MDYIHATTEKNEFTTPTRSLCRDFEWMLAAKLNNKTSLGDIQKEDGSLTSVDHEKAELLNKYFTSVFTREDTDTMPIMNE